MDLKNKINKIVASSENTHMANQVEELASVQNNLEKQVSALREKDMGEGPYQVDNSKKISDLQMDLSM